MFAAYCMLGEWLLWQGTQQGRCVQVQQVAQWHTYGVLWTAESIVFYIDNIQYHQFNHDGRGPDG